MLTAQGVRSRYIIPATGNFGATRQGGAMNGTRTALLGGFLVTALALAWPASGSAQNTSATAPQATAQTAGQTQTPQQTQQPAATPAPQPAPSAAPSDASQQPS